MFDEHALYKPSGVFGSRRDRAPERFGMTDLKNKVLIISAILCTSHGNSLETIGSGKFGMYLDLVSKLVLCF